ncbi:hypothetical protein JZ751_021645 [Albula glossodonta]|uniref:Uncharacterized protein n=1 Tax=Albula glossodonta TaxID=121402 RepID=A0A8T2NIK2_9TELE|nr:hypothetical protein JZ751_021645 [Albula glossodonta]
MSTMVLLALELKIIILAMSIFPFSGETQWRTATGHPQKRHLSVRHVGFFFVRSHQTLHPHQLQHQTLHPHQLLHQTLHPDQLLHQTLHPHELLHQTLHPHQLLHQTLHPHQLQHQTLHPHQLLHQTLKHQHQPKYLTEEMAL